MRDFSIYLVEMRKVGQADVIRELKVGYSLQEIFDYYMYIPDIVYLTFEDITNTPVEDLGRRLCNGEV
jgi:hypothetical protein